VSSVNKLLSLRVQQTALFVIVVLVAVAVLSTWIFGALSAQVADSVRVQQMKDATAVAEVVGPYFPLDAQNAGDLHDRVKQFGDIFDDDVRVYDLSGTLVESRASVRVPGPLVSAARAEVGGVGDSYAHVDFGNGGLVVAAAPYFDRAGGKAGIVVVSNPASQARGVLSVARGQLTVAALVTLLVAGLLGFLFSDFIARQARRLLVAANAVAEGDFSRRLPRGPFPGEIRELVEAFNRMAGQLGDAFETLRGQEQAQRQFVANASHELRTPIAALKGAIEILETGGKEKPDVRDEFLGTMRVEVNRLQRLVDNLFTLAQVDSGRLHLQLRAEPANEMVWVIATAMRPLANDAGVAVQADIADEDLHVTADRDYITQVLLGLVDNAVKHSKPGDIVTVAARAHGDTVRLSVSDTGSGIPEDVLPHIFDRFYTQRKTAEGQRRGSGLGLAIAAEIVEAHGSVIDVSSQVGDGTTFSFDLPRVLALTQP
jgi:signal transduction histidine kinase